MNFFLRKNNEKNDITSLEKDYNDSLSEVKKKLNIRIIGGIAGCILTIMILMSFVSVRAISKQALSSFNKELLMLREERKSDILGAYQILNHEMEKEIKNYFKYPDYKFSSTTDSFHSKYGIENISLLDSNFKVMYNQNENENLSKLKKSLKKLKFQDPFYVEGWEIKDNKIYQYIHYNLFSDLGEEYYLSFKLNDNFMKNIIKKTDVNIDLFNEKYYVIFSTRPEIVNDVQINDVTKNMLSGKIGIESIDGTSYSYSFIDLEEAAMYIQIYSEGKKYKSPIDKYMKKLYLIWFIGIVGIIATVLSIEIAVRLYSESYARISLEKKSDSRYGFLKKEILDIFEELDEIKVCTKKINAFNSKLNLLKQRIVHQNKNLIKKLEAEQEMLKKIETDEELKQEVAEKLKKLK